MALTNLTERLKKSLMNGISLAAFFFDLSKTFDTVHHKILLKKLQANDIRGICIVLKAIIYQNAPNLFSVMKHHHTLINLYVICTTSLGSLYCFYCTLIIYLSTRPFV